MKWFLDMSVCLYIHLHVCTSIHVVSIYSYSCISFCRPTWDIQWYVCVFGRNPDVCLYSYVFIGPPVALAQQDVVLLPLLMPWDTRAVVGHATVLQQLPQSKMSLLAYANYTMGPFCFRVELLHQLFYLHWCLLWCLLSIFTPLQSILMAGICASWNALSSCFLQCFK